MDEIYEEICEDEGIIEWDYLREEEEIEEDDEYDFGMEFEVDEFCDIREYLFILMGKFKILLSIIYLLKVSFVELISMFLKCMDFIYIR